MNRRGRLAPAFPAAEKARLATLTETSWNQLTGWLEAVNRLRESMAGHAA